MDVWHMNLEDNNGRLGLWAILSGLVWHEAPEVGRLR